MLEYEGSSRRQLTYKVITSRRPIAQVKRDHLLANRGSRLKIVNDIQLIRRSRQGCQSRIADRHLHRFADDQWLDQRILFHHASRADRIDEDLTRSISPGDFPGRPAAEFDD